MCHVCPFGTKWKKKSYWEWFKKNCKSHIEMHFVCQVEFQLDKSTLWFHWKVKCASAGSHSSIHLVISGGWLCLPALKSTGLLGFKLWLQNIKFWKKIMSEIIDKSAQFLLHENMSHWYKIIFNIRFVVWFNLNIYILFELLSF